MHHKFGLTPFPLTSARTKRPSKRVAPQASRGLEEQSERAEASRAETPVAGTPATITDVAPEEGAE